MLSTSQSLFSAFYLLCTIVQAKPHAYAHGHQHASRVVAVPDAATTTSATSSSAPSPSSSSGTTTDSTTDSGSSNIGIVYDSTSDLTAFSGNLAFSVDWSPLPLSSSDNLDLGTFIPQLWTFQDSNREPPYHQGFNNVDRIAN